MCSVVFGEPDTIDHMNTEVNYRWYLVLFKYTIFFLKKQKISSYVSRKKERRRDLAMNPYMDCGMTRERLREYKGFENMSDEELDIAVRTINTMAEFYLNNKSKIEEYERSKK